ncbi:BatD family protein [Marinobacterium arenosum]|uniref:BatD family protein n=1 Tax=Marinobacterium arenosum TaxID=2862496 RepID=UPI001C95F8E5|nr:BatD family protein [Marinobacterium arenosum]MBY4677994.1 BatD family protein [Marinobacterium arenosum]
MRTLLLTILFCALPAEAAVNAYLDRYTVAEGSSLRLTLESDQQFAPQPDLSPLHADFQVLGTKKMTISSHSRDGKQASTRWRVLLRPRRSGPLSIPALLIGNEQTAPLQLTVEGDQAGPDTPVEIPAILEALPDTSELYVDSQLLLTLRLWHRKPLPDDATLSSPQLPNATVKPFGNPIKRQMVRRGQAFHVLEKRYLIFPHKAGVMQIPAQIYSAGSPTGVLQEVKSAPLTIDVLPAALQQQRGYWLPSSEVTLEDSLQQNSQLQMGESLERSLTIRARGVTAKTLPALSPLTNELARIELLQVELDEEMTSNGLISSRIERLRITPTERGEVTLKPIRIPWWHTRLDRSRQVEIGPRLLNVTSASTAPSGDGETAEPMATVTEKSQPMSTDATPAPEDIKSDEPSDSGNLLVWLLTAISIISALGWLYTFHALRTLKRAGGAERRMMAGDYDSVPVEGALDQDTAFQALTLACQQGDALLAREALLAWAQRFWPELPIENCADISQLAGSETLNLLILDLEQHIYDDGDGYWQGDLLLQAVDTLRSLNQADSYAPL